MTRGFVYLAAVVDWFSRRVPSWRLSITMEVEFCLEAVEEALAKHGRLEVQFVPELLVSIQPWTHLFTPVSVCVWVPAADQERAANVRLKF
jgi:transposase InsO family protein